MTRPVRSTPKHAAMSEYQYYEFQAIDRHLTREEQAALRACSSRARISATHFVNEYHWGDLKGAPMEWMEKYFDAHLYLSNFGSRSLVFRFPLAWIDEEMIQPYEVEGALDIRKSGSHLILSFMLETDPGEHDDEHDGTGILSSLLAIRAALASGDPRALYLGWLSAVQNGLVDGSAEEPPVSPGLNAADNALECLAGFLHVSGDLLKAAAKLSTGDVLKPAASDVAGWLAALGPAEKDRWLSRILLEDDSSAVRESVVSFSHQAAHRRKNPASRAAWTNFSPRRMTSNANVSTRNGRMRMRRGKDTSGRSSARKASSGSPSSNFPNPNRNAIRTAQSASSPISATSLACSAQPGRFGRSSKG